MDWDGEGFAVHSSTWRSCAKGEWRVSGWLAISNRREKISYFSISVFAAFLRARNPCRTHKYFIYSCFKKSCGKKSVKKHAEISLVLFSFASGFQRNLRKVIVGFGIVGWMKLFIWIVKIHWLLDTQIAFRDCCVQFFPFYDNLFRKQLYVLEIFCMCFHISLHDLRTTQNQGKQDTSSFTGNLVLPTELIT